MAEDDLPPPPWLTGLPARVAALEPEYFAMFAPPPEVGKRSAVLILFGASAAGGQDVLLTERSYDLRSHAGQVSFPGGRIDPEDDGPVAAALRETLEEVGVEPAGVEVIGQLPGLFLQPSGNAVTPVLAWWRHPCTPDIASHLEVSRVVRARIDDLVDPARRFTVIGPSGYRGPGFDVDGLFVWGFTAKLLESVLDLAGLSRPWDAAVVRPLPEEMLTAALRDRARRTHNPGTS